VRERSAFGLAWLLAPPCFTVVCAAAEAIQVMPDAIRPALRAAFRRARLAGLSVAAVETALGDSTPAAGAESPPAKAGSARQKAK
jgi:hypothetical protein